MTTKTITVYAAALLIAAGALSSCSRSEGAEQSPSTVFTVRMGVVADAPVAATMRATGSLEGIREALVTSETQGRIVSVAVSNGSKVGAGSALVTVDNELKTIAVQQAEAGRLAAEAALAKAKVDLARTNELSKTGATTKSQMELAELQVKSDQAQLEAAISQESLAKRQLSDATVKAPFAGTVATRFVNLGEVLNSGTHVAELVDDSKMKLKVPINELDVPLVTIGNVVSVSVDAIPGKTFEGKIMTISDKADGARSYLVEIELDNPNKELKSGMFARAEIKREAVRNAPTVPIDAVINNGSRTQVYLVDAKGVAHLTAIKLGVVTPERAEVLEGLKDGDNIVTFGQSQLRDGVRVQAEK